MYNFLLSRKGKVLNVIIKKLILTFINILCVIFFSLTVFLGIKEINSRDSFKIIDTVELKNMIDSSNDFYIYFFKNDCVPCASFKSTINKYMNNNNLNLFAVNVKEKQESDKKIIDNYDIQYTPTVIHFVDGKEQKRIEGSISYEKFELFILE